MRAHRRRSAPMIGVALALAMVGSACGDGSRAGESPSPDRPPATDAVRPTAHQAGDPAGDPIGTDDVAAGADPPARSQASPGAVGPEPDVGDRDATVDDTVQRATVTDVDGATARASGDDPGVDDGRAAGTHGTRPRDDRLPEGTGHPAGGARGDDPSAATGAPAATPPADEGAPASDVDAEPADEPALDAPLLDETAASDPPPDEPALDAPVLDAPVLDESAGTDAETAPGSRAEPRGESGGERGGDAPAPRRVLVIGDSSAAGMRWTPGASDALQGAEFTLDLESCRRLVAPSCRGREGHRPPTALDALRAHAGGGYDTLVMAAGYNDTADGFDAAFDEIVHAARAQGVRTIVWTTYREDVGYELPSGAATAYAAMNESLWLRMLSDDHPELQVADWWSYTAGAGHWFASDGVHFRDAGSFGLADYLSRWLAALDGRPCPAPWHPGETADDPCPVPDALPAERGGVPPVTELHG